MKRIGRRTRPHDCRRDELPAFMSYRRGDVYTDDYVQCSCGQVWLCTDGRFYNYKKISISEVRRLIRLGEINREDIDADSAK